MEESLNSPTVGIHWIVTTHGSWLHGDPRGSWLDGKLIGPDPFLEFQKERDLRDPAEWLSPQEIELVAKGFGDVVVEQKHPVYAATIRSRHAHLVFGVIVEDIESVIARLKRRSAMDVFAWRRTKGLKTPPSLWTRGRFPRYLTSEAHLASAIEYVQRHNLDAGLPADLYRWIQPPPWGLNT